MNGSMSRTTEREGKQEEDAYPEEALLPYSHAAHSPDDGASNELSGDDDNDVELPYHALKLPLHGDGVKSLVGLELPVYSTNMERVLQTVGGLKALQQTHETKSQFLPVKLRPSEPSCKPLFADLTKTQTLLLRLKRKKGDKTPSFEGEIVGVVREKYVCEGMADFQYFTARQFYPDAVTSDLVAKPSMSSSTESSSTSTTALPVGAVMPADAMSTYTGSKSQLAIKASLRPYLRVQEEPQLEMVPEVFSKVDLPLKYEFRQRSGYQPTESAKKPSTTMTYLNFHDDTPAPAAPRPDNPVIRRRPVGSNENVDDDVLKNLQDKLAQKPIWLRPKLFVGLDFVERRAARRILRKLCYVFVDGPWRGSWIRMGYDPRTSSDSAKYQVIELRNNRELVHAKVTHPSRKRTKKYSGINPKGPRIAKVTQTSEHENSQANKRRRKERFLRGETRRSFLVDPSEAQATQQQQQQQQQSTPQQFQTPASSPSPSMNDRATPMTEWDSDNDEYYDTAMDGEDEEEEDEEDRASSISTSAAMAANGGGGGSDKTYEIFGVPLTSANVLFQLDEIDDEEVVAWIAQFQTLDKPTLLGGWYATHMFLPLREIIRYRIAALVGRSKGELETRRKRIEALKKQALNDYADQLAGREPSSSKKAKQSKGKTTSRRKKKASGDVEADADEEMKETEEEPQEDSAVDTMEDEEADEAEVLEASLAASRISQESPLSTSKQKSKQRKKSVEVEEDEEEEEEEEEEEDDASQDEDAAEVAAHGRLQKTATRKNTEDEDDEEEEEEDEEEEEEEEDDGEADEEETKQGEGKEDPKTNTTQAAGPSVEYSF